MILNELLGVLLLTQQCSSDLWGNGWYFPHKQISVRSLLCCRRFYVMCLSILVPKLQQTLPESRFASNKGDSISASSEKNSKAEPKAEAGAKARSSSNTPTSPKPPLQATKPSLAARPTVPQKPRSASRTGEELFWVFAVPSWVLLRGVCVGYGGDTNGHMLNRS